MFIAANKIFFAIVEGRQFYGGGGEVFYIAIGNFTADKSLEKS